MLLALFGMLSSSLLDVAGGPVRAFGSGTVMLVTQLASMPMLAMWARLGCCPHLTVILLARLARMLQGALLAQMIFSKFWNC